MSDHKQQIQELLRTARGHSDGDVAILQAAANLADLHADTPLGLTVRLRLINAANGAGNPELAIVAFTWCLAKLDQFPEELASREQSVLWYYKWVVDSLSEYAQVSRDQIEKSFADMEQRYTRAGLGVQPIDQCRAYASIRLGDIDAHRAARSRLVLSGRTAGSDCLACQTNAAVNFDLEVGDLAAAVQTAAPILDGRQKCAEVPCITYGVLLLPLLAIGQPEEAEQSHRRGIRQALSTRDMLETAGYHCAYLAVIGKLTKAISVFETALAWFYAFNRSWDRMMFLQSAMVLFDTLAAKGDRPVKLKIPESAEFFTAESVYMPSAVLQSLGQMHGQLIDAMNRRNGNDYLSRRHQRYRDLAEAARRAAPP